MTADNITVERLQSLVAVLQAATESVSYMIWEHGHNLLNHAEAAAIVNETIENLTNEAR